MQSADLECFFFFFFFFFATFFLFLVFCRYLKFMMTGLMVPMDSPWFILWSPLVKIPRICHGSLWDCVCCGFEFYMTLLRCHQFMWHWFRHDFVHDRTWMVLQRLWRVLIRCHQFNMGHQAVPLGEATSHGSTALPPIRQLIFFFSIFLSLSRKQWRGRWSPCLWSHMLQRPYYEKNGTCSFGSFINMDWRSNEILFFFIHCSKIFNFAFIDLSSSRWRGRWYPWIRHGSLCDRP